MTQQQRTERPAPRAGLFTGWTLPPANRVCAVCGLWLCGALLTAPAQAGRADEPPAPPAESGAGLQALENLEGALVAVVREAGPSVVTIEGQVPVPKLKLRILRRVGVHKRTDKTGQAGEQEAEQTAEDATRLAEKSLEAVRKQIERIGGVPITGSGFLLRGGLVVTTAEVTRSLRGLPAIVLADGTRVTAEWVNTDSDANIAVMHVSGLDPQLGLRWGDSGRVFSGSFVFTIGNEAGFPNTFSWGYVAGTGRSGRSGPLRYNDLIQFHGAVGAGGSGGPLLNMRGEVVGMIVATPANAVGMRLHLPAESGSIEMGTRTDAKTAVQAVCASCEGTATTVQVCQATQDEDDTEDMEPEPDQGKKHPKDPKDDEEDATDTQLVMPPMPPIPFAGGPANTGFALPSNDIQPIVELLSKRASPAFRPGWLGVKLSADEASTPGALIAVVYVGGPADKAGLRPGDVVVSINGQAVTKEQDMRPITQHLQSGDTLHVEILRKSARKLLNVDIDARPDDNVIRKMPVRKLPSQTSALPCADGAAGRTV